MSWKKLIDMVDRHANLKRKLMEIESEWKKMGLPSTLLNGSSRKSAPTVTRKVGKVGKVGAVKAKRVVRAAITDDVSEKVVELYKEGNSVPSIAKTLDLGVDTIYRCLRKKRVVRLAPSAGPKQSTVATDASKPSLQVLEVITSMATNGMVTRATVRKEAKRMFRLTSRQVGQCIAYLERQQFVSSDSDTVHVL